MNRHSIKPTKPINGTIETQYGRIIDAGLGVHRLTDRFTLYPYAEIALDSGGIQGLAEDRYMETWDDPAYTVRTMQDCAIFELRGNHQVEDRLLEVIYDGDHFARIPYARILNEMVSTELFENPFKRSNAASDYSYVLNPYHLVQRTKLFNGFTVKENPFESEFSIWFLLVDLKELPKLIRSSWSALRLTREFRGFRGTCKEFANYTLEKKFGWDASIQDFKDCLSLLIKWGATYGTKNTLGDLRTIKNSREFHPRKSTSGEFIWFDTKYGTGIPPVRLRVYASYDPVEALQCVKYYFIAPELTGALARLKQLVDRLGLLDPTIFWDLLPWSFVVDWFYPVSQWIHSNMKPQLFPATPVLADYCESIIQKAQLEVVALDLKTVSNYGESSPVQYTYPEATTIWKGYQKRYARVRKFPPRLVINTPKSSFKNPITMNRAIIGSALVAQRSVRGSGKNWNYAKRRRA